MEIKVICRSIEEYECKGEIKYTVMFLSESPFTEITMSGLLNKTYEVSKTYIININ